MGRGALPSQTTHAAPARFVDAHAEAVGGSGTFDTAPKAPRYQLKPSEIRWVTSSPVSLGKSGSSAAKKRGSDAA